MVRFAEVQLGVVRERGVEYGGQASDGREDRAGREVRAGGEPEPGPLPVPDPFSEPDALEDLGDEIATIAARIHQATHRLLVLLAEFDRRRGWELGGHRSAAHWLSFRTGIDLGAARERVRAARALTGLPEIGAAMSRGELSFSKVRALTRAATAENESELLAFAQESSTASLERLVRGWKKRSRREEAEWERLLHETRTLSVFPDDEGMYVVRGRLDPEVGALLMRALEAAGDALFREKGAIPEQLRSEEENRREAARRRADAIGLLAERAMGAGFGEGSTGADPEDGAAEGGSTEASSAEAGSEPGSGAGPRDATPPDEGTTEGSTSDSAQAPGGAAPVPISGSRAERYQVVLHVDPATLSAEGEPGQSELEDGTRVSAEAGIHFAPLGTTGCGRRRARGGRQRHPIPRPAGSGDRTGVLALERCGD